MTPPVPDSRIADSLAPFFERSRWFGGKGRGFTIDGVRRVAEVPGGTRHGGADGPRVAVELVTLAFDDGETDLYQVPLAFYPEPPDRLDHAYVGEWDDPDFGHSWVYDAPHDREAMALWLRAFADPDPAGALAFHRLPGHDLDLEAHASLYSGEQSNSTVFFGDDSLMKIFRRVTPGVNPDVQVHEVLTRAGCDHVAALYGWLDTVDEETDSVLQLAMLQQFLRTGSDGFELAKASVRNLYAEADLHPHEVGGDFAAETARLGVALAETHQLLADLFPTQRLSHDDIAGLAQSMRDRLAAATGVVPELETYADAISRAYDDLAGLDGVEVQRIHGDLHLGQTMRTVKGWKIVDFEGEPAKPLHERLLPDSPWRDVAGMLRSFEYAPHVVERTTAEGDDSGAEQRAYRAEEWIARNRAAFVSAYAGRELTSAEQVLLAAYETDKAVYETVYETRNRPSWVGIPLSAIARLAGVS